MTNHVHLIVRAKDGFLLPDILRDYKKFTSKAILKAIRENVNESRRGFLLEQFKTSEDFCFWVTDNHPIELWSNSVIDQKIEYLHQNPVEEGLVFKAEDYIYSSAVDYAGGVGLLEVIVVK